MSGRDRLADFQAQSNGGNGQGYNQQQYGQQQQQYGDNQYGGNQYGGNQHGGNQYGGNQYGGNQYGGNQYNQQNQQNQQNQYAQQNQFAQNNQAQYGQQQPSSRIEMTSVSRPGNNAAPAGGAAASDMGSFFSEVSSIQDDIAKVEQNINKIEKLHNDSLNSVTTEDHPARRELEALTRDTTQLSNRVKKRIKDIELANLRLAKTNSPDIQIRQTQAKTLKNKFLDILQRYQRTESDARKGYQNRMERQIRIVKPDATPQEISEVIESDNQQIFAQSVLQSTRYGDANRALREVQSRHDDIKRLEKTIVELHQLFIDMETLVTEQAEILNTIEENTQQTDVHLETGNKEVDVAIVNARGARKKKWICLAITIVLLIVIVLIILFQTGAFKSKAQ